MKLCGRHQSGGGGGGGGGGVGGSIEMAGGRMATVHGALHELGIEPSGLWGERSLLYVKIEAVLRVSFCSSQI